MMKIRKNIEKRIAILLIFATLISGCGEVREIPELLDPVTDVTLYRSVGRGTVGQKFIEKGLVVPTEYSQFFTRRTTIKEICCDLGQYVNEGDILAIADIKATQEELTELQASLDLLLKEHEINTPIHELNTQIINTEKQGYLYVDDQDSAMECYEKLKLEDEDKYYDEQLYQYTIEYYNKEIAEARKLINEGTLRAKKSGYVTYVKDTSKSNSVGINEAVVVIADYDDYCIELPTSRIGNNKYARYELKKAVINGKEVPIEEYEYTTQEIVHARAMNSFPSVRYKTTEPVELNVGDCIPLIFVMKNREDVLCLAFDSLNADEGGNYVYVKNDDGTLEKRYVQLGITDSFYAEVTEGVSEGEMVLYTQESVKPSSYEEYTVETGEYNETLAAKNIQKAERVSKAYFAPANGKITELNIAVGDEVKKGDVLAVIDKGSGTAEIKDIDTQIKHLKMDHDKAVQDADKEISTLHENNLKMQTEMELMTLAGEEECVLDQMGCQRRIMELQEEIMGIQKQIEEVEYEENLRKLNKQAADIKKNNDGTGKISIVAENDGVVSKVYVTNNTNIELLGDGKPMFSITNPANSKAILSFKETASMPGLGVKATVKVSGSDENYEGEVISCANNGKTYIRTEEDNDVKVSVVQNPEQRHESVIVDLHDEAFFDKVNLNECKLELDTIHLDGIVVLPGDVVMHEESNLKDETYPFVWKIENGELVKRYIVTGTDYGFGNDNEVVVFSGVEPGDVLAREKRTAINTNPQ